ncbi:hypothetical protein EDB85DRAFT_1944632 [Lactarius pseudohatsudake]|nr:hypothetical protein EDB85DRAFT_1944632 [Lactarius pseudohatsudake]
MPPPLPSTKQESFHNKIILPVATALNARLNILKQEGLPESQQMPLVLVSQGQQPTAAWLTTPAAAPSQGELAVQHLLEVVQPNASGTRCGTATGPSHSWYHPFLSTNVLHDHRGHIAHKPGLLILNESGSALRTAR